MLGSITLSDSEYNSSDSDNSGNSLVSGLIGAVLLVLGIAMVIWNERHGLATHSFGGDEKKIVIAAPDTINPANEGQLVFLHGLLTTSDRLTDLNGLVKLKALRLSRHTWFYQWKETYLRQPHQTIVSKVVLGDRDYKYDKDFIDHQENSSTFAYPIGHINPKIHAPFEKDLIATIQMGKFKLSRPLCEQLKTTPFKPIPEKSSKPVIWEGKPCQLQEEHIFVGSNPLKPQIGDERIYFSMTPPDKEYSVVARQHAEELEPIVLKDRTTLESLRAGNIRLDSMFKEQDKDNTLLLWGLRFFGWLLIVVGLYLLGQPIAYVLSLVPPVNRLANLSPEQIGFGFGTALTLITIGIGIVLANLLS